MFMVNNTDARTTFSSVFIVKFEFISYIFYVFLIMTLNMYLFEKRKDSLETRAELAFVSSSVENQAILESILLYRASKCKQTKEHGSKDYLRTHIFSILWYYCQLYFFSLTRCKQNKTKQNCVIICSNLSKKRKLALHKTQGRARLSRS